MLQVGIHRPSWMPSTALTMAYPRVGMPGIKGIKCTFGHGGNWQPSHMTVGAHLKLAERRELVRSHAVKSTKTPT